MLQKQSNASPNAWIWEELKRFSQPETKPAHLIPRIYSAFCTGDSKLISAAAAALVQPLAHLEQQPARWMNLARQLHQGGAYYLSYEAWRNLCPEELCEGIPVEDWLRIVRLGTAHRNGYFRMSCLESLAPYGAQGLNVYLLAMNDHIKAIRLLAKQLAFDALKTCSTTELVLALPYANRLLHGARREQQDAEAVISYIQNRLFQEVEHLSANELRKLNLDARKCCYRLLAQTCSSLPDEQLAQLLHGERDPFCRLLLVSGNLAHFWEHPPLFGLLLHDRSYEIRRTALRYQYETRGCPLDGSEQEFLLDRSAAIRSYIQFLYRYRQMEVDTRDFYRSQLHGPNRTAALVGFCDVAQKEDCTWLKGLLGESPQVTRAVLGALARVIGPRERQLYLRYLQSPDDSVSKAALRAVEHSHSLYSCNEIFIKLSTATIPHVQNRLLELLIRADCWENLPYLFAVSRWPDPNLQQKAQYALSRWHSNFMHPSPQEAQAILCALDKNPDTYPGILALRPMLERICKAEAERHSLVWSDGYQPSPELDAFFYHSFTDFDGIEYSPESKRLYASELCNLLYYAVRRESYWQELWRESGTVYKITMIDGHRTRIEIPKSQRKIGFLEKEVRLYETPSQFFTMPYPEFYRALCHYVGLAQAKGLLYKERYDTLSQQLEQFREMYLAKQMVVIKRKVGRFLKQKLPSLPLKTYENQTRLSFSPGQLASISQLMPSADTLQTLYILGKKVHGLEQLKNFHKLKFLSLSNMGLRDLSFLSGLTQLSELVLHTNQITDISPLESLQNLKHLHLANNQIKDFSVLHRLPKLKKLMIDPGQVPDEAFILEHLPYFTLTVSVFDLLPTETPDQFQSFSHFEYKPSRNKKKSKSGTSQQQLNIRDRWLFSGIANALGHFPSVRYDMQKLRQLDCSNQCRLVEDFSFLSGEGDFSALQWAVNLKKLNLSNRILNDFSVLKNCTKLTHLDLSYTNFEDLQLLENFPELTQLNLADNPNLLHLEALASLEKLQQLTISEDAITPKQILELLPQMVLTTLWNHNYTFLRKSKDSYKEEEDSCEHYD